MLFQFAAFYGLILGIGLIAIFKDMKGALMCLAPAAILLLLQFLF